VSSPVLRGRVLLVYAFCCAIWGSTWLFIRIGVRDLPPLRFAAFRMALACLLLTPIAWRRLSRADSTVRSPGGARPTRAEWKSVAWCGFLQIGVTYAGIFLAAKWIESGLSALLFATFPLWVALFAHWILPGESLTKRSAAAVILGVAGVAIIEAPAVIRALHGTRGGLFAGGLLVLGSAVVCGYSNVHLKQKLGGVSPVVNVWGQTLSGSLFLLALAAAFEWSAPARWTLPAIGSLVYLAIFGTVLTFAGLFWLAPKVPVSVIGTIPLVDMLIAVLLGAIFLGEALPPRVFAGGALILAGVFLAAGATGGKTGDEEPVIPGSATAASGRPAASRGSRSPRA